MSSDGRDLLFVLGTRPEIIKLAPVIRAVEAVEGLRPRVLHTGQHYDEGLSGAFFEAMDVLRPDKRLEIGSGTHAEQTANAIVGIETVVLATEPDAVLALGDTNAVLSAALASCKTPPTFVHIEAGIRSFDRSMPEEVNRVLADSVSDILFPPTQTAVDYLADEGVTEGVWMVGNPVVDACLEALPVADEMSSILQRLGLERDAYSVATIHRARNTDDPDRLGTIAEALDRQTFPVVLPLHPRTKQALDGLGFEPSGSLELVQPLDYLDFLKLLDNARLVVTDSGGVQEEASILEVPCLTVRPNTERPETVDAGVNQLLRPEELADRFASLYHDDTARRRMRGHPDLYGDGNTADRIVEVLRDEL